MFLLVYGWKLLESSQYSLERLNVYLKNNTLFFVHQLSTAQKDLAISSLKFSSWGLCQDFKITFLQNVLNGPFQIHTCSLNEIANWWLVPEWHVIKWLPFCSWWLNKFQKLVLWRVVARTFLPTNMRAHHFPSGRNVNIATHL